MHSLRLRNILVIIYINGTVLTVRIAVSGILVTAQLAIDHRNKFVDKITQL